MKVYKLAKLILPALVVLGCQPQKGPNRMEGTWKLLNGTLVEKGKVTTTDYTTGQSFIKVINATHFTFLLHDLGNSADSARVFSAGGGTYDLNGDRYTEHLEYCSDRAWEGHNFDFTVRFSGDTMIQKGTEKVGDIERLNTEKYLRMK